MIPLSVIIPMYNVQDTIRKCIYSVIENDLDPKEYEVIVVDDESPDRSLDIANEIALEHGNIKVVSQTNKGLGGARNKGIETASGKYLLFLDSDDFLSPNVLRNLINSLNSNPDILEFGAASITTDGKILETISVDTNEKLYPGTYYWQHFSSINSACNKLYRREFLVNSGLLFRERIFAEDFEFNTRAFYFAKNVMAVNQMVSNFVRSENSITRNKNKESKRKYINDFIAILGFISEFKNSVQDHESFFNERLTILNVDLFIFMVKNKFSLPDMKKVRAELIEKNIFYINHRIRIFPKNLIRIFFLKFLHSLKLL